MYVIACMYVCNFNYCKNTYKANVSLSTLVLNSFTNFITKYKYCILNSAGVLLVLLTYAAIQIVYCHCMLAPCVKCLWYVKF